MSSFQLGQWLRALRPFMCHCGHARSHHASGRGHCARCVCPAPARMTKWSLLTIGYRLGLEAGRLTSRVSTVTVHTPDPDPPTVAIDAWENVSFSFDAMTRTVEINSPAKLPEDPYEDAP